jgi:3-hydroxyisobutyrate dehydrogenase
VIGIGAMGMAIARNLQDRAYPVWVRDIRAEAESEARQNGLQLCATASEMAHTVDVAIIVVVNAQQIDAVLSGDDGLLARAAQNSQVRRTQAVLLCSTIAPQDTTDFACRLAAQELPCIDGPISGGPARARAGTMSMMLAAPQPILEQWSELLQDMADKRFVVSPNAGDAAKAKLVNNMLAAANLVAGAEALALAQKLGLDTRLMFDLICASSGASWMFADRMARVLDHDYQPRAAAHILTKDVTLAVHMAHATGHATPLGDAARARLQATLDQGWTDRDDAAVIKTWGWT